MPTGGGFSCPSGTGPVVDDELRILCDLAPDGTATPFLRRYTIDAGVVTVTDTLLDGVTPYTPAGEVGLCQPEEESPPEPCLHCQAQVLCDDAPGEPIPPDGTSGTLGNGVGWSVDCSTNPVAGEPWWAWAVFPCAIGTPQTWIFDRPVAATWGARVGTFLSVGQITMPEGTVAVEIHPNHVWDPATRTLFAGPAADINVDTSHFEHPGPVAELVFTQASVGTGESQRHRIGEMAVSPAPVPFMRNTCRDCAGVVISVEDATLDGDPYEVVGQAVVCHPPQMPETQCVSAVQTLRLCDLDPAAAPDSQGRVCATQFLRHLVFDCDGAVAAVRDTTVDGVTGYSPVQVVDCHTAIPALAELDWPLTAVDEDPAGPAGQAFIYTITNPVTGETAEVRLAASSTAGPAGCPWTPPASPSNPPIFNNPSSYTYTLDGAAQAMSRFRLDFLDLDGFEGVRGLNPIPDQVVFVSGAGVWNGSNIDATVDNSVVQVFWNTPPETISHSYANSGGGNACHAAVIGGVTLVPDGCCTCDDAVSSPGSPGEPTCRNANTVLLCDLDTTGSQAEPDTTDITDETVIGGGIDNQPHPGGGDPLWTGGTITLGPDTGTNPGFNQRMRYVAATLTAVEPACSDGTATVTVSVDAERIGPDPGRIGVNGLYLRNNDVNVDTDFPPNNTPVGWAGTLTVTGQVPATDLAVGTVEVRVRLETYDAQFNPPRSGGWNISNYTAAVQFSQAGCGIQFLRNLTIDCGTGQVVAVEDTDLDGNPYAVTGDVGQCEVASGGGCCPEECRNSTSLLLCDQGGTPEQTEPIPLPLPDGPAQGVLPNGVAWTVNAGTWIADHYGVRPPGGTPPNGPQTWTFDRPVRLRFGMAGLNGNSECAELPPEAELVSLAASHTWDPVTRMLCGPVVATPQTDTSVFATPTPVTSLTWQAVGDPTLIRGVAFMEVTVGGPPTQFLRTVTVDCDGNTVSVVDTTLDGQPYEPTGEVAQCAGAGGGSLPPADVVDCDDGGRALLVKVCGTDESPSEEFCRNTNTLLLCDLDTTGAEGVPTVADTLSQPPPGHPVPQAWPPLPGGGSALWAGGSLVFPADPDASAGDGNQVYRGVAATLTAPQPGCDDGTAQVTVSVHVTNDGPNPGSGFSGALMLIDATNTIVDQRPMGPSAGPYPPGFQRTLTVTGTVPAADLAAGNVRVGLWLETFQGTPKQWTADQFEVSFEFGQTGCETQFLRNITLDCETGQVVAVEDTDLDGNPYTPMGEIGQCEPTGAGECCPPDPCRNTSTLLVCDIPTDAEPDVAVIDTDPSPYDDICPRCLSNCGDGTCLPVSNAATLWAGGTVQFGPDPAGTGNTPRVHRVAAATMQADRPACDDSMVTLTVSVRVTLDGPNPGWAGVGGLAVIDTDAHVTVGQLAAQPTAAVGYQDTLTLPVQVDAAKLAAGSYVALVNLETYDLGDGSGGTKAWTVDQFTADVVFGLVGCETQLFANVVTDCENGNVVSVSYTDTAGDPYTPTGEIGDCKAAGECCPPEPCRNTSTLLVCDLPIDGEPDPAVTDTSPDPYWPAGDGSQAVPGGAQLLWDGGSLTVPPDTGPAPDGFPQHTRTAATIIQAPQPACDDGTATVTATVRVQRTGPDPGCVGTGGLFLHNGTTTRITGAGIVRNTPVGHVQTLTVTAQVPAADVAAGTVAASLRLETYHLAAGACPGGSNPDGARIGGWTVDEFSADVVFDQADCATQVFANVVTDCETGQVESVTYTTPDGQPYEPTGEIGECQPVTPEPCGDTELAQLCDLVYSPQAPIDTPAADFTLTGSVEVAPDVTALWFSNANQPVNGVAELTVTGLLPGIPYEFHFASTWIGAGGPDPANTDAIYLLEILDGATVLATRTRNLSNGSTVFPGGTLAPDLPPLAFIAPATGQATIRFTDQTTGGGVDRDLFIRPRTVQTAALELTATPFLRRYLFDCAGTLSGFEDLTLDGELYEPVGEVGRCPGDRTPTEPCEVASTFQRCMCDDLSDESPGEVLCYQEIWSISCQGGPPTLIHTYRDDPGTPYEPINPVPCESIATESEQIVGVQALRVQLAPGQSFDIASEPLAQSVTVTAVTGEGEITDEAGTTTLFESETATWSVVKDIDLTLRGPLVIAATTGTLTLNITRWVTS